MKVQAFVVTARHRIVAALRICRTQQSCGTAELQGFIVRLLSIEVKYESLYDMYTPEGHNYFQVIHLYYDAAAMLAVNKAIS